MDQRASRTIDRRLAIGGLAAAAAVPWTRFQVVSRIITQRGIGGGGLVRFEQGEAQFSLFVSSLVIDEGEVAGEPNFLGSVLWVDGSVGLTMQSVRINSYENMDLADAEGRRIEGDFAVGEAGEEPTGEQPFVLEVVHAGLPGSEQDRVTLTVGGAGASGAATPSGGFTYVADGQVVIGDVQDIDVAIDLETGEVSNPDQG